MSYQIKFELFLFYQLQYHFKSTYCNILRSSKFNILKCFKLDKCIDDKLVSFSVPNSASRAKLDLSIIQQSI